MIHTTLVGCGDVGRRIAAQLIRLNGSSSSISGYVGTQASKQLCAELGVSVKLLNLDDRAASAIVFSECHKSHLYYTVAPQLSGLQDLRSRRFLSTLSDGAIQPQKVVLISTTGVYGDSQGAWVNETSPIQPQAERAHRRADSEAVWSSWCAEHDTPLVILRVPGIYSRSRIPRARLEKRTPVVVASECGYSNRVHADDLALTAITAMHSAKAGDVDGDVFNVTDGRPGSINEYLQAAAKSIGMPPLPEISMREAEQTLSAGMLSYLRESRRISNKKMIEELGVSLQYPDFVEGLKH